MLCNETSEYKVHQCNCGEVFFFNKNNPNILDLKDMDGNYQCKRCSGSIFKSGSYDLLKIKRLEKLLSEVSKDNISKTLS